MGNQFRYTPEMVEFLREGYKLWRISQLTKLFVLRFGVYKSVGQIRSALNKRNIRAGRCTLWKNGNTPWNTGTAGTGLMKANKTSFSGQTPHNYKPIGHEYVNHEGYVMVKVAEQNPWNETKSGYYRHKHLVIWEEANGPVPPGYRLRFIDSDRSNVSLENLALITDAESLRMTVMRYDEQPQELRPTVIAVAKLDQAIYEKQRNQDG